MARIYVKDATGNVGIGTTTTPAKLSVLGVSSNPTIPGSTSTAVFRVGVNPDEGIDFGKAGAPSYAGWIQSGYQGTSMDPLALQPVGGNVGIGTTTPAQKLDVNGKIQMRTGATAGYVPVSDANGTMTWTNPTSLTITETDPQVSSTTTNYIPKWNGTALVDGLAYDNGTNIGIGTTTPLELLELSKSGADNYIRVNAGSSNANSSGIKLNEGGFNFGWNMRFNANDDDLYFEHNNSGTITNLMKLDNGGNIGIGTTAPGAYLDITGTNAGTTSLQLRSGNTSVATSSNQITLGYSGTENYRHAVKTRHSSGGAAGNSIDFYVWKHGTDAAGTIGTQQVMTVDGGNGGSVGIGTTAPAQALDVNGKIQMRTGATAGYVPVSDANGTMTWTNPTSLSITETDPQVSSTTTNYVPKWSGTSLVDGVVFDNGSNVGIGNSAPNTLLHLHNASNVGPQITLSAPSGGTPGIVFRPYQTPAQWSNPAQALISATDNNYSADIHFQTKTPGALANALVERMTIQNDGHVGIGSTSPTQALLVVSGSVNTSLTAEYFNNSGGTGNTTASRPLSAYFSSHIACSELQVFSDERIKNIKGISDTKEDLNTLMNIKITDYTFKDSIGKGTQQIKKVIAQQVEKVYPQAVSTLTDIVPDIYKIASIKDGRIFVENNLKAGEKVKLIFENRTELVEVLEADANGFNVNLSDEGKVFVFGREVSDFHTVDYEAISMLNVSATQELSKQLKAAQAEIEALKNANSLLQTESNTKINTMQTQIDMITEHLNMKSEK